MECKVKIFTVIFILGLILISNSLATSLSSPPPIPYIVEFRGNINSSVPISGNITVKIDNKTYPQKYAINNTSFKITVIIPSNETDDLNNTVVEFYLNGSIPLNTSEPIVYEGDRTVKSDIVLYYNNITTPTEEEGEEETTPTEEEEVTPPTEEVIIPTIPTIPTEEETTPTEEEEEEVTTPEEEETTPTEEEVTPPTEEETTPTEEEKEETTYHTKKGPISILSPINKIIAEDLISKEIGYFVYRAEIIVGSEIDLGYARYLKNIIDLTDKPLEINEDCILVGGPVANPVVKKYLDFFPVKITNEYPGKHRGVIEVTKINGNTVVLLAGSDRQGTKAAVEYFKTLEDLPDEPVFVEWRDGEVVKIERP